MAHHKNRSGKLHEPLLEEFERFGVEVVRRLVQHDHVGRLREELGQQHPVPLAARQESHLGAGPLRRKEKILQVADDVPPLAADGDGVVAAGDVVGDRFLAIELAAKLVEIGHGHLCAEPDGALVGRKLPEQQPQERSLSGAVGADDAHLVAAKDVGREA